MNLITILTDAHGYGLTTLSVFLSVLAAYAALDLAGRITAASGLARAAWLFGSSAAMGTGIWAMHYVDMSAADTVALGGQLDWNDVLLSFGSAFIASGIAFYLASKPSLGRMRVLAAGLFMGSGIASAHYIGRDAMHLPSSADNSPLLVLLTVLMAAGVSTAAFRLSFARDNLASHLDWHRFCSAGLLGLAIPITYYVGSAADGTIPRASVPLSPSHSIAVSIPELGGLGIVTLTIFFLVLLTSVIDRRALLHAQTAADREIQLQTIFDNLAEGIVVLDSNRNVIQMNRRAMELFGLKERASSIDEALDSFEMLTLSGLQLTRAERPISRALKGEFVQNQELQLKAKGTGDTVICTVNSAPITNRAGETVQLIIRYRDITERKRIDEARTRLAEIVESSEDAIIGKDLHGIVLTWNKGAEKIFGYSAEEMVGQSILRLLPPGHEHEEDEILARIHHGEIVDHFETLRKKKNGQIFHASLTISPMRNSNGEIVGASKIARDITDRKLMERQLHQSQKMEAIGQLTGGIAHDFNNLLGIIVGNLDLLERAVTDRESALKRVQTAQRAATRGADLTRRLLAFSSREELRPTQISLQDSIQNMIQLASHAIGPEIIVTTHIDKSVPAVFVDPARLESALLNLVVNARDAMPKGGSLTISTRMRDLEPSYPPVVTGEIKAGAYACVTVSDTGHGMSQETMERAFEPFFTTKPRDKGTGLGLAMVYGFVKQSKGTIRLYSEVGYGTTVSLYLPLADKPLQNGEPAARTNHVSRNGGKVLVVDDEIALVEIASAYLEEMGYTTIPAEDATTALEALSLHSNIDLMITDIIMPGGVNGMELAQKVRTLSPATKIIFTSGFPSDALAERSGTSIDGPLLNKPYQRAEFTAVVRQTMEETRTTPENCALSEHEGMEPGAKS